MSGFSENLKQQSKKNKQLISALQHYLKDLFAHIFIFSTFKNIKTFIDKRQIVHRWKVMAQNMYYRLVHLRINLRFW